MKTKEKNCQKNKEYAGIVETENETDAVELKKLVQRGGKAGKMVYDFIIDNCTVFAPEKQLYEEAMQTYLKYDGTLSLIDTINLEVMKIFNIQEIVSFDSDFDKVKGITRIY